MRTIDQMIQSEVLCCMSSIVYGLAQGYGLSYRDRDAMRAGESKVTLDLIEQAFELASPIPDYEESAIQAGWRYSGEDGVFVNSGADDDFGGRDADSWQELCEYAGIDPYDREVFEHWAVTDWFADKLIEAGEKVDKDFGNLCIWARTTTGQGIASDGVIERIYAKTHQKEEA